MARTQGQSDFVVYPAASSVAGATELAARAEGGAPGEVPTAIVRSSEASEGATRWVMGLTWFMLIVLVLLCVIGPHIPSGQ